MKDRRNGSTGGGAAPSQTFRTEVDIASGSSAAAFSMDHLLSQVRRVHDVVNEQTERVRKKFGESDEVTIRAELAGAALCRLIWAIERRRRAGQLCSQRIDFRPSEQG